MGIMDNLEKKMQEAMEEKINPMFDKMMKIIEEGKIESHADSLALIAELKATNTLLSKLLAAETGGKK